MWAKIILFIFMPLFVNQHTPTKQLSKVALTPLRPHGGKKGYFAGLS